MAVIGTQLTLVLLAAPAATAGAICLDRSRGTLTHLLVTDLTDREIVLGKLAARLTPVLVLVAATLPVMELLTLLGGVDPDALLGAFVVTLGVAVLGCCLALVFSIRVRRTHEALLATYAVWGLWLLGTADARPDRPGERPVPVRPACGRPTPSCWPLPPTGGRARWTGKTTWPSSPGPGGSPPSWPCWRSGRCGGSARATPKPKVARRKRGSDVGVEPTDEPGGPDPRPDGTDPGLQPGPLARVAPQPAAAMGADRRPLVHRVGDPLQPDGDHRGRGTAICRPSSMRSRSPSASSS